MVDPKPKKKILFLVSEDKYFCSHRLNLGISAIKAGFDVAIATRCNNDAQKIRDAGILVYPLEHFTRAGLNPIRQCQLILELYNIYKNYHPDVMHHVALKPIILGSLVAWWCKVPRVINALGGLGYLFTEGGISSIKKRLLHFLVCKILKVICSKPNNTLILQNSDDLETLLKDANINPKQVCIIRGAGVATLDFPNVPSPKDPPLKIACVSRLLWDKGIGELVLAAKILHDKKIPAEVLLYGTPDPENPSSISEEQLKEWHDSGVIIWKGHCEDVAKAYANCHIAVLPSYREGLPKSLLEAASCGRPIVTTDVPGCREIVNHKINGLLVPAKNSIALANALFELIQNEPLRVKMGKAGRERIEHEFSDQIIHQQTLSLYADPFSH